jgi:hypothetical protein
LAEIVIILPGTTIVEEFHRYNTTIDAITTYYHFQEGGTVTILYKRPLKETNPQLAATKAEKQVLREAILLVFIEKRTTTCFLYLGE